MEKRLYLAYGSNLNVLQMRMRCPDASIIGTAEIPDYRLLFKGSKTGSYLTIEPAKGSSVLVGVWQVSQTDERALDRYEGYPRFYYKQEFSLPVEGIRSHRLRDRKCFAYIMREDRPQGSPTPYYMEVCLEGYRKFAFDENVLMQAYRESEVEAHENK